jgi:ubiquinone/menaquinone biosynthesis C-methylase UbiE
MSHAHRDYLPAFGRDSLLPLYDPLVKLLGADRARTRLIARAALQPQHRVLDIGCGTGTFVVQIKQAFPRAEVVGLDPDPRALARGRHKAERAGVQVQLDEGFADAMPYADASFDRVFSSLMLHHLPADTKLKALQEVHRTLKPGGSLHLLDFAGPDAPVQGRLARLLHGHRQMRDNSEDKILGWMREAGFREARRCGIGRLLVGTVLYYEARR